MGDVLLRFNDACDAHKLPKSKWYLEYDAIAGAAPKSPFEDRYEICFSVIDHQGQKLRVWPDAMSSLSIPDKGKLSQLAFAWEYDRSTETQTQLVDKLEPYAIWIASKGYQQHYAQAVDIRVCFVLQSRRRLKTTIDSCKNHRVAKYLRFVLIDDFTPDKILAAPIWYDANGKARRIITS